MNQRDQSTDFDFEAQNQDCRNIVTSSGIDGSIISDGEFSPESHLIGKYDKLIALGKGIISVFIRRRVPIESNRGTSTFVNACVIVF